MPIKWLPNLITITRIALAPLIGWLVYSALLGDSTVLFGWAFGLFVWAAGTDWLDGFLARALKAQSELGAQLDLWADKVLVFCVLVGVIQHAPILALSGLVALTFRDLYIMRLRAQRPDVNLKASQIAKFKTAIVLVALGGLLLFGWTGVAILGWLSGGLLALGCALSVYSAAQYIRAARAN